MKKIFISIVIVLGCVGANEFLVERKISSVKDAQEELCSLRVGIMQSITDTQIKVASVLHRLATFHDQLQEDFFAFATSEKNNLLSSKDKQLLNKKIEEALHLKTKLMRIQSELELFLK